MATETRSHAGCWSCRLRKKKCDERHPICTECMCVGIECHGFGEKPAWMDRGARQKAEAAKMKQKVTQVARNRRMNQIRDQNESSLNRIHNRRTSNSQPSTRSINNTTNIPASNNEPLALSQPPSASSQNQVEKDQLSTYHQDNITVAIDPLDTIDSGLPDFQTVFDEINFLTDQTFDLPEIDWTSTNNVPITDNTTNMGVTNVLRAGQYVPRSEKQIDMDFSPRDSPSMLTISDVEDAALLAYYVSKVFHWQFRFCSSAMSGFNQGHFIWLMSKSRPLYLASLALSSSYRSFQNNAKEPQPCLKYEEHMQRYDIATEELQGHLKGHTPMNDVTMLACIVSFISSSFLHSGRIDGNVHLKAGISLIAPRIARQQSGTLSDVHKTPEESSRDFLTGSIIRFDILSAITRDTVPSLSDSYRRILRSSSPSILLETVSGCQNWVFDILLDVYALRDWKRNTRAVGLLSLWELTAKANMIKSDLERRITSNLMLMNESKQEVKTQEDENLQSRHYKHEICVITHTFACAVSILLEVIVSGAYPQVPEIKQKVGRALESFAYIDDPDIFEVLTWPLFVVGCVVEEDHHECFRQLLSSTQLVRSIGLYGLKEILEKCWKSRETGEIKDESFDFSHFHTYKSREILIA